MTANLSKGPLMSLKRFLASAAAVLSLGTSACATVDTPPAGAVPGPALWQVADADTTIYLFGTVHALPQGRDWFDGRIERAFNASDELVTEIDLAEATSSAQALQPILDPSRPVGVAGGQQAIVEHRVGHLGVEHGGQRHRIAFGPFGDHRVER